VEHEERVQDARAAGRAGWRDDPSSTLISQDNNAQPAVLLSTLRLALCGQQLLFTVAGWATASDGLLPFILGDPLTAAGETCPRPVLQCRLINQRSVVGTVIAKPRSGAEAEAEALAKN